MQWKIWYASVSGAISTHSNEDGPIEKVPTRGVQIIVCKDKEVGQYHLKKECYYWVREDEVFLGGNQDGLVDYLLEGCRPVRVLQGRVIEPQLFRQIENMAVADPSFPKKTAYLPWEKR